MKRVLILIVLLSICLGLAAARKALVIGNAAYDPNPLKNPLNDALDVSAALQRHGFDVVCATDLDKQGFYNVVGQFSKGLAPGDEALFFYSGHGMQIDGKNYLIPVGDVIDSAARVKFFGYDCSLLLSELETAAVSVIILDACRNNPFSFSRDLTKGMATVQTAPGTQYIVHSTGAGKTADDGVGRNSPFTEALLANIDTPRKITDLIQVVTDEVARKTLDNQIPWSSGNLRRDFYIAAPNASVAPEPVPVQAQVPIKTPLPKVSTQWYYGSIKVETNMPGALYLDDVLLGQIYKGSAVILDSMLVGEHLLRLETEYGNSGQAVRVTRDTQELVVFSLQPPQPTAMNQATSASQQTTLAPKTTSVVATKAATTGDLIVSSDLDGELWMDGKRLAYVNKGKLGKISGAPIGLRVIKVKGMTQYIEKTVEVMPSTQLNVSLNIADVRNYPGNMHYIREKEFTMGNPLPVAPENEKPKHPVLVSNYYIMPTEVTQKLWTSIMGNNPSIFYDDLFPVTNITWYEAIEFCNKLSSSMGFDPCYTIVKNNPDPNNLSVDDKLRWRVMCDFSANGFRLPTEAEWEYAARAGDLQNKNLYSGGTKADKVAWLKSNAKNNPQPVATKPANDYGLYDMSGNVYEWCWDYMGEYTRNKQTNPTGPEKGSYRIIRGGSWMYSTTECTVTHRSGVQPDTNAADLGLRLVRNGDY